MIKLLYSIEAKSLTKSFGDLKVLNNLNLEVKDGEKEESLPLLCLSHFEMAIEKVYPSVSVKDREGYLKLRDSLRGVTGALRTPSKERFSNEDEKKDDD